MKILHLILALIAFALPLRAADVVITDPANVTVDGVNFGAVADTIANNPALAADVQKALVAYVKAITDAKAAAETDAAAKIAAAEDDARKKLEAAEELKTVLEKPTATDAEKAAAKAKLAESKTPEVARERKRLRDEKAAIQAKLDALPTEKAGGGGK